MVGTKMSTRGGGKKRGRVAKKEGQDITQVYSRKSVEENNFVSPSSQFTTQIVRTPDDLDTYSSPFTHGSTLKRRVIETENVNTPTEQHTECTHLSGRNLSPILRTPELMDKDRSDTHVGADIINSSLQLGDAPTPMFDAPLHLKSGSHDPKSAEKKVSMDGKFKCASVIPSARGYEELNFSENSSDSLVQALDGNLPTKSSLPSSMNLRHLQNENHIEPGNNSEESRNVILNVASSNINKTGAPRNYSLNTIQMVEEMEGELCEVDSLEPDNTLVTMKGYQIKSHHAELLNSIISKHGDIGSNCSMVSLKFRSICLEHVCDVVQKLKEKKLKSITDKELESMMDLVSDLEKERVNVGWLRKRLDDISEAKKFVANLKPGSDLKELHMEKLSKVDKIKEELEQHKRVLLELQKNVRSAETALSVAETELSETGSLISEISMKVRRVFRLESLGADLL